MTKALSWDSTGSDPIFAAFPRNCARSSIKEGREEIEKHQGENRKPRS